MVDGWDGEGKKDEIKHKSEAGVPLGFGELGGGDAEV
jgi:hypothetical protein